MAKRKNARAKATRKATTAVRKPAKTRAAKAARAKGASASSRAAGRKKAAPATRKAGKSASKKTVKTAKKAAPARVAKKAVAKKSAARGAATRAASTRAKAMKPVKAAKGAKAAKATKAVKAVKATQTKAMKSAKVNRTARAAAPKTRKPSAPPIVAIAVPAPAEAVATNGSPAKAAAPRKASKRDLAGAKERATTRHSEPSVNRPSIPSSLTVDRSASQARSGRAELKEQIKEHTESSPALTAGDVDADWEQAYSSGDEAPGGDNPTPDQDRVDEIGHALGVEYQEGEELKGADKISERDKHRWELDPASSEDYPDRDS
jgi:hypothetical protein